MILYQLVIRLNRLGIVHRILHAGAAAIVHADAQIGLAALLHDLRDARRRGVGQGHDLRSGSAAHSLTTCSVQAWLRRSSSPASTADRTPGSPARWSRPSPAAPPPPPSPAFHRRPDTRGR